MSCRGQDDQPWVINSHLSGCVQDPPASGCAPAVGRDRYGAPVGRAAGGRREAQAYLLLALRLDRLAPGVLGSRPADLDLARRAAEGPRRCARDLQRDADRLLADLAGGVGDGRPFLRAQVRALRATAGRLAGASPGFVAEVRETFGVTPRCGDPDRYAAAHRALDALLPGPGTLATRVAAHRSADEIPRARLAGAVRTATAALRARVRDVVALPPDEGVESGIVDDAPWSALHRYLGRHRSQVWLSATARPRASQLVPLLAHEVYPGHHTEAVRKDVALVAGLGRIEHAVQVTDSPQSVLAEGLADAGLGLLVGPGWGAWAQEVLAGAGVRMDGALAERVAAAQRELLPGRLDAALLMHDRGADEDTVLRHLRRWLLLDDVAARRALAFLAHPRWRAYVVTYVEGLRRVEDQVHRSGVDPRRAFVELLDSESLDPSPAAAVRPHRIGPSGPRPDVTVR
jgi:hypothetical protein